jgi:DNA-binding response OmpR family regulator
MHDANVLVVEDDDTIRRLLVEYLKQHSYVRVDGARDGVEGLHLINTGRYRVIVLDVMMPKMSGVDLLESLQAMLADSSVKRLETPPRTIVITAAAASALPNDVFEGRFPTLVHAVFRKPLDMTVLAELVEKLLRESATAR